MLLADMLLAAMLLADMLLVIATLQLSFCLHRGSVRLLFAD